MVAFWHRQSICRTEDPTEKVVEPRPLHFDRSIGKTSEKASWYQGSRISWIYPPPNANHSVNPFTKPRPFWYARERHMSSSAPLKASTRHSVLPLLSLLSHSFPLLLPLLLLPSPFLSSPVLFFPPSPYLFLQSLLPPPLLAAIQISIPRTNL